MATHSGPRRPSHPKVYLPLISEYATDKLTRLLHDRVQSRRAPDQSARVLVLMVKMWQSTPPIPFPDRKQVAAHLGVSVACVDVVLSDRQGTGDISIVYRPTPGNVRGRLFSTKRERFVIVSDEICRIVNVAELDEAAATAGTAGVCATRRP